MHIQLVAKKHPLLADAFLMAFCVSAIMLLLFTLLTPLRSFGALYWIFYTLVFLSLSIWGPYWFSLIKHGTAIFTENAITIQRRGQLEVVVPVANLSKILITLNETGLLKTWTLLSVLLQDQNGADILFAMLLRKKQRPDFIKLLQTWYRAGLPLKEGDTAGGRGFLLNANLKYAEIQQIKADYHINWI